MDETNVEMSGREREDDEKTDVKPKNPEEILKAKKRARAQKRLSTMKNKVLRNAQWATLKKEKRKRLSRSPP